MSQILRSALSTPTDRAVRCVILLWLIAANFSPNVKGQPASLPRFGDYPVSAVYRGAIRPPDFGSPEQYQGTDLRCFGGSPKDYAREQINFAGHFVIGDCACGTGCRYLFMWDAINGKFYGRLPPGVINVGPFDGGGGEVVEFKAEEHRADSSLLIVEGCAGGVCDCAVRYYRWNGSEFDLILRQPSRLPLSCR